MKNLIKYQNVIIAFIGGVLAGVVGYHIWNSQTKTTNINATTRQKLIYAIAKAVGLDKADPKIETYFLKNLDKLSESDLTKLISFENRDIDSFTQEEDDFLMKIWNTLST